ncbi:hypothetical protein HOK021_38490 [Streptomyces hygroscopicus]|nr:hypothetical protein HOK021_38490 [Streptomyces hygroscopicus]
MPRRSDRPIATVLAAACALASDGVLGDHVTGGEAAPTRYRRPCAHAVVVALLEENAPDRGGPARGRTSLKSRPGPGDRGRPASCDFPYIDHIHRISAFLRLLSALCKAMGVDGMKRASEVHGPSCPAKGGAAHITAMQKGMILND